MVPNICNLFFGFLIQDNSKRMQYSRHSQIDCIHVRKEISLNRDFPAVVKSPQGHRYHDREWWWVSGNNMFCFPK